MISRRRTGVLTACAATVLVSIAPAAAAGQTNPFQGSVPTGTRTLTPLTLTLRDAIDRGLATNLGVIQAGERVRSARADWLERLSNLLPSVTGRISANRREVALATLGFKGASGITLPPVIGPFSYVDARASASQRVFNWSDIKGLQSASALREAAAHDARTARELVVLAVANAYLVAVSDQALVEATRAQVETGTALLRQTSDQNKVGVVASIDVLRARVELQTEQQRLIAAENQLAIDKLALARAIGLPNGQEFVLADELPYSEAEEWTLEDAIARAYASRPDYQSALAEVRAAERARESAAAERYPSLAVDVDYGAVGTSFASANATTAVAGSIAIPIFQGASIPAHVLRADAALRDARAQRDDLAGRIDAEVRTALLNLRSAGQLVSVARSNVDLAQQTLAQAQDRLAAGVADNLEVVQAQESIAAANQSFIASLYAFNAAKVSLAQAVGVAEQAVLTFLTSGSVRKDDNQGRNRFGSAPSAPAIPGDLLPRLRREPVERGRLNEGGRVK